MKKINGMIVGVVFFYVLLTVLVFFRWGRQQAESSREYLVEANRLIKGMEAQECFSMPALHNLKTIEAVSYLAYQDFSSEQEVSAFLAHGNEYAAHIEPLVVKGEILGLVRFDYRVVWRNEKALGLLMGTLLLSFAFLLTILVYVRNSMIKPFYKFSNLPYELSKGHMQMEMKESKDQIFGKFLWGIDMLRDNLETERKRALKLEKEKKMLLLSLSHDIKTPLNSITLYAKALREGIYRTEEEKQHAFCQIGNRADEIEEFVKRIVKSSSEEIVPVEIANSEFYLREFVEMIQEYYEPKCRLFMIQLHIGPYGDKLIKGDKDKALEVVGNIMENAFKYGDGKRIDIFFHEEEGCQLVQIRNTGELVKPEEMPHLFDSFYRGSNVRDKEGNGLGLYICREMMRKMEGEVFAQAWEGGMSFTLVFLI